MSQPQRLSTPGGTEVLEDRPTVSSLRLPGLRLTVVEGPEAGRTVTASRGVITVGTAESHDLTLTDPGVSRSHCEIRLGTEVALLRDLKSTNGTTIDGVRVIEAILSPASLIRVGSSAIRAVSVEEEVVVPLSNRDHFGRLLGRSVAMRQAFAVLERVAPTEATVLLEGETGTGKELAAEALHARSPRSEGPFITVDCGAIAPNLIESELFGHLRGSFTGADRERKGAFEEADGGTVFLDEVGELPLDLQPKLLRALEAREIRRVGESRAIKIDLRVVAATNRDLVAEVNKGQFREDLFFRLAVVHVRLPSLRVRPEDIPLLVRHFVEVLAPGTPPPSPQVIEALSRRAWPGNVRELRNAVERAVALAVPAGPMSRVQVPMGQNGARDDLLSTLVGLPMKEASERWIDVFERAYVENALRVAGSVSAAARAAAVSRRQMQRLMKRLGLREDLWVADAGPDGTVEE